jgi:hypothetical protein
MSGISKAAAAKRVENPIEDWEQDTALVDAATQARQEAAAAEIAESVSAAVKTEAGTKPSKFSAAALRVSQDFTAGATEKIITKVTVGRPPKQAFVRVHPDPAMRIEILLIKVDEDGEFYLVRPGIAHELPDAKVFELYPWITRQGGIGLWPVGGPGPDGKINAWHVSARRACHELMKRWGQVRTEGRGSSGGYIVEAARAPYPDPVWPENVDLDRVLELAFEDRDLDSLDHPVVQKLLGTA